MTETVAVVMDPLAQLNPLSDTSFALMLEAQARGHRVVHVRPGALGLDGAEVLMHGTLVELFDVAPPAPHCRIGEALSLRASDCAAIFIRTDPPFDTAYLTVTWLLSFAERAGVRVINSPRGLRSANEKLYGLEFPDICPETIITHDRDDVRAFVEAHDGEAIAKPLDGFGGFGVLRLRRGDTNLNAIVDTLTLEGQKPIVVQRYLPEGALGDKRLFMVGGELRAALQRVPSGSDHRGNVHAGGSVHACLISDDDRRIAARIGPRLAEDGLYFAGLDVIAGKLIEVNVTSPTLTRELKRLGGPDIVAEIIGSLS